MPGFKFNDQEYKLLTDEDLTFAEGAAVCRAAGVKASDLRSERFEVLQALVWVSIRRHNPDFLFSELNDVPISAIEFIEDEEPPAPEAEALADPTESEAATSDSSD